MAAVKPTLVSVLGLGLMGRPFARALAASGYEVRGWNRSRLARGQAKGIRVVALAEAAAADVLLLVLADTDAVGAVLSQLEPHLRPGRLVVDLGTSRPSDSLARAARLAERGVGWVDAPVSGGPEGVSSRSLAIMAGGHEEDVARALPVLSAVGRPVRVGGPGAGHAAKLVNQAIVTLTIEAVAEALVLAEGCGLDPRLVQQALRGGSADSRVLQVHGTRMIERAYAPGAKATVMRKDLRLVAELAGELGLDLPHVRSTLALYEELVARGDGDLDGSALHALRLP